MPKKKFSSKDLQIRKTPMISPKRKKVKIGKVHKKGLCAHIGFLFHLNEIQPRSKKMTDGEIARQIYIEFKHYPELKRRYALGNEDLAKTITSHRSEYNRGRLLVALPPPKSEHVSFCYDEDGDAVNRRFVTARKLTEAQKTKQRDKFRHLRIAYQKDIDAASKV